MYSKWLLPLHLELGVQTKKCYTKPIRLGSCSSKQLMWPTNHTQSCKKEIPSVKLTNSLIAHYCASTDNRVPVAWFINHFHFLKNQFSSPCSRKGPSITFTFSRIRSHHLVAEKVHQSLYFLKNWFLSPRSRKGPSITFTFSRLGSHHPKAEKVHQSLSLSQ